MSALYNPWPPRQGRRPNITAKAWRSALILSLLSEGKALTARQIASELEVDTTVVAEALRELEMHGAIKRERIATRSEICRHVDKRAAFVWRAP